jgi:NitT/TauT family transport system permease protein
MTAAIVVTALVLWEAVARTELVPPVFFPPVSVVAATLWQMVVEGVLFRHLGITLWRVGAGVLCGCLTGCALGLTMGWLPRIGRVLDPIVAAFHPLPKIAILPLLMVMLGIGETTKVAVVAIAAFFPMLLSSLAGVRQISPELFEVARCYGANRRKIWSRVILPGSLPLILTGLRLAVNVGLLVCVAAELVAAQRGLGALVWLAWQTLRADELFAGLVVIATFGVLTNLMLDALHRRFVRWQS